MGMSTILVLGGSNGKTLEKLAPKRDCQVIFHDGKNHGGVKKTFRSVIKKFDVIVIQKGALCGHVSIDVAKEYAKKYDIPLLFNQGFGGTGALEMGLKHLKVA
jgi:predicted secreted protein